MAEQKGGTHLEQLRARLAAKGKAAPTPPKPATKEPLAEPPAPSPVPTEAEKAKPEPEPAPPEPDPAPEPQPITLPPRKDPTKPIPTLPSVSFDDQEPSAAEAEEAGPAQTEMLPRLSEMTVLTTQAVETSTDLAELTNALKRDDVVDNPELITATLRRIAVVEAGLLLDSLNHPELYRIVGAAGEFDERVRTIAQDEVIPAVQSGKVEAARARGDTDTLLAMVSVEAIFETEPREQAVRGFANVIIARDGEEEAGKALQGIIDGPLSSQVAKAEAGRILAKLEAGPEEPHVSLHDPKGIDLSHLPTTEIPMDESLDSVPVVPPADLSTTLETPEAVMISVLNNPNSTGKQLRAAARELKRNRAQFCSNANVREAVRNRIRYEVGNHPVSPIKAELAIMVLTGLSSTLLVASHPLLTAAALGATIGAGIIACIKIGRRGGSAGTLSSAFRALSDAAESQQAQEQAAVKKAKAEEKAPGSDPATGPTSMTQSEANAKQAVADLEGAIATQRGQGIDVADAESTLARAQRLMGRGKHEGIVDLVDDCMAELAAKKRSQNGDQ